MKKTIFLVSGIGLRPELSLIRYWRNVPKILNSLGFEVVLVKVDAFGSIESNVEIIASCISEYFINNQSVNVECHVWGHSKGGLEVLNLVSKKNLCEKITSFVLLNAPIQGALMAKRLLNAHSLFRKLVIWAANSIGKLMGDTAPNLENALKGLSKDYRSLLCPKNRNIYIFQSVHAFGKLPWVWKPAAFIAYGQSKEGDGIVEHQDLSEIQANFIHIKSIDISKIMHSSVAGIPYFGGLNSAEFRDLWIELVNIVCNSNGIVNNSEF